MIASVFCIHSLSAAEPRAREQPNVVVILTDDQGWGDLSLHGNPNLATPNIDSLARDGARIEHFYVCAVCSPTRAEFLTGRYHTRLGVTSTSTGGERFDSAEQTVADAFRDAGYATAAYGKWHSGMQWPYHPNARGFDDFYGFCSGHWGNYFSPLLEHNGRIVQGSGYLVDDLTSHAVDFIGEHRDQPFFVYLPLNTPHSPMQVPDEYWEGFAEKKIVPDPAPANAKAEQDKFTRAALAMCENIDANVGRLLHKLDELNLADDTIVVYFSDNGPNSYRFNGGMRGRKGSVHEGGLRSPCLIRYPSRIDGGRVIEPIAGAIDLLPTLADFAGIEPESPRPLDGRSMTAQLLSQHPEHEAANDKTAASIAATDTHGGRFAEDRLLFSAWRNKASVRSPRYRYHKTGELYDIHNDPGETNDVSQSQPETAQQMRTALADWLQETKSDASDMDQRPFTVGHPEAAFTQLPARDAVAKGGVVRSNRFPNCTFMTHWTSADDAITWDVDVLAGGEFQVQMYYSCAREDVGSRIELTAGDARLQAVVTEPHEVPLIGAKNDRVERMESYVKDWKPMTLGTIRLKPGRATLRLTAKRVARAEVADMRLLTLKRLSKN